jgi:hypothetical protein
VRDTAFAGTKKPCFAPFRSDFWDTSRSTPLRIVHAGRSLCPGSRILQAETHLIHVCAWSIVLPWLAGNKTERVRWHQSAVSKAPGQLSRLPRVGFSQAFANTASVVGFVMQERKQFVVNCKDCRRDVPSGAKEFPFQSVMVECPLCGELRRYMPSEVFLGRPNHIEAKQPRA